MEWPMWLSVCQLSLGKPGMEQVMEIKLTDSEKADLKKSADDV